MGRATKIAGTSSAVAPSTGVVTSVPYVTSLTCGTPIMQPILALGRIVGEYAALPMSYDAPNPLSAFVGVQYYAVCPSTTSANGLQTVAIGKGTFTFTGTAGVAQSETVLSQPVTWPTAPQSWDIYAVSVPDTLILKGKSNSSPFVTVTVGGTPQAPNVLQFQAGTSNSDGTWTPAMRWDALEQNMLIDWACMLPVNASSWGGVAVWINTGVQLVQATGIIPQSSFVNENGDGISFTYRDTIAVALDSVPPTSQSWTFIATSYGTTTPQTYDTDGTTTFGTKTPTGPSVALTTLIPLEPVTILGMTYAYIWAGGSQAGPGPPQYLQLTITYQPPASWTGLGVNPYVEYPDQSTTEPAALNGSTALGGSSSLTGSFNPLNWGPIPDDGTHVATINELPVPTAAVDIRVDLCSYNQYLTLPLVRANQPGASPTVVMAVYPPKLTSGEEYCSLVTNPAVSWDYAINADGQKVLVLNISCTPPSDANYGGFVAWLIRGGNTDPGVYQLSGLNTGSTCTSSFSQFPISNESDLIYLLSTSVSNQTNTYVPGLTPSVTFELEPPPIGVGGTEFTNNPQNLAVAPTYSFSTDGTEKYGFQGSLVPPTSSLYTGGGVSGGRAGGQHPAEYGGCTIVLRNEGEWGQNGLPLTIAAISNVSGQRVVLTIPNHGLILHEDVRIGLGSGVNGPGAVVGTNVSGWGPLGTTGGINGDFYIYDVNDANTVTINLIGNGNALTGGTIRQINDEVLAILGPTDTTFNTSQWPLGGTYQEAGSNPTFDCYAVGYDVNGHDNNLVPGTTPSVDGLTPQVQSQGALSIPRLLNSLIANDGLGPGLATSTSPTGQPQLISTVPGFSGLGPNSVSIENFVSNIRPVVFAATAAGYDMNTDPTYSLSVAGNTGLNGLYPAGTLAFNVPQAGSAGAQGLYKSTGLAYSSLSPTTTGWVSAVNGATDILANSIGAGIIQAGAVLCTQLGAGFTFGQSNIGTGGIVVAPGPGLTPTYSVVTVNLTSSYPFLTAGTSTVQINAPGIGYLSGGYTVQSILATPSIGFTINVPLPSPNGLGPSLGTYAGTYLNGIQITEGFPVNIVYAGTIFAAQLGSGQLPVGVIYAGSINCTQLNAGTINAAISITAPTINGGVINSAALNVASGTITINIDGVNYIRLADSSSTRILTATGVGWTANIGLATATLSELGVIASSPHTGAYPDVGAFTPGRMRLIDGSLGAGTTSGFEVDVHGGNIYTATSATAGSLLLPTNPIGFLVAIIAGTSRKIPYYAT